MDSQKLVSFDDVSLLTNRNKKTIWGWVRDKKFPEPVRVGRRTVGWRQEDISQWLNCLGSMKLEPSK